MKNVAIVCGGDSGEFEISIKSAQVVKKNLNPELYDSKIVVVSKKGWYCLLDDGTHLDVDKNDFSVQVNGKKIKFWKVDVANEEEIMAEGLEILRNGTVLVSDPRDGLFIKTKEGILKVLEIQGENAKRMPIGDFLRGNYIEEYSIFE